MNRHEFEITAALNNHDDLTSFGIFNFIDKNFTCLSPHIQYERKSLFLKWLSNYTIFCANIMARKKYKDKRRWDILKCLSGQGLGWV
jgi:hypothetical protein